VERSASAAYPDSRNPPKNLPVFLPLLDPVVPASSNDTSAVPSLCAAQIEIRPIPLFQCGLLVFLFFGFPLHVGPTEALPRFADTRNPLDPLSLCYPSAGRIIP